jgi:hypothetical protein
MALLCLPALSGRCSGEWAVGSDAASVHLDIGLPELRNRGAAGMRGRE